MTSHAKSGPVEQITFDLGQRSYDILMGPGLVDDAGSIADHHAAGLHHH